MKKSFLFVTVIVMLLLLDSVVLAQKASTETQETTMEKADGAEKEAKKAPALKSLVRKIGSKSYAAPGQMKKAAGVTSASLFARKPGESEARKKKIFEEAAQKFKPQKSRLTKAEYEKSPLKGKHIPQKPKAPGKFYK